VGVVGTVKGRDCYIISFGETQTGFGVRAGRLPAHALEDALHVLTAKSIELLQITSAEL